MHYDQFNAEDFVMDDSFQQYCSGTNEEAESFWTNWIAENKQKRAEIEKAKKLCLLLNGTNGASDFKKHQLVLIEQLRNRGIINSDKQAGRVVEMSINYNRSRRIFRLAAAVVLGLVILSGTYVLLMRKSSLEIAKKNQPVINQQDVAPGGDKATLTLANGQQIILDSAQNGKLTTEGNAVINKEGGLIVYTGTNVPLATDHSPVYNTITTPKGGQYQLVLADGSKVWLNSISSIRFPTAFVGSERRVEITGEAYFEVAHDPAKPFKVSVSGTEVEVLGTHFNINAYTNEDLMRTTLLEGKVRVSKGAKFLLLHPGQQATTDNASENIRVNNNIDLDEVIAWKDGLFNFEHSDLKKILREIERWYDVEVRIDGSINEKQQFFGIGRRNSPLTSVMNALKIGSKDKINYRIEGKKLIVQSVNKN